jgi:hypothetical protein
MEVLFTPGGGMRDVGARGKPIGEDPESRSMERRERR